MIKKKIRFIINPIAGKGVDNSIIDIIQNTIDKSLFDVSYHISSKQSDVESETLKALSEGVEIIVAVGGDGTVNEIARHLVFKPVILGIIPTGSGNGLANFLHIPKDVKKAIEIINAMNVRFIDTGTINNFHFFSVAGIGFDAKVAKSYAESGTRGFKAYFKSAAKTYIQYKPAKYKIRFNDHIIARKALLITFANTNQYGYNTSIAPDAIIDDGLLNMCILQKVPIVNTPLVLPKLFTGKIHTSKFHESYLVDSAIVYRKRRSVIHIDGEPVKMKDRIIYVHCHKHSLQVLV